MKNIYDILNDTKVRTEDYEPMELNDLEKAGMKQGIRRAANAKKKSVTRWAAVAACMVCVIGFSQTAYAKEAINNILQTISLGHSTVMQVDPSFAKHQDKDSGPVYYDKDGNPIIKYTDNMELYDANGKKDALVTKERGGFYSFGGDRNLASVEETDLDKASAQLNFKLLTPKNIPKGYGFDHSKAFVEKSTKKSDNVILSYKNSDDQITITEIKVSGTETSINVATDASIEKTKVNGYDAALTGENNLTWEQNGVSINITAPSLTKEELLSLAKSFQ